MGSSEETGPYSSIEGETEQLFPRQEFEQLQSPIQFDCGKNQMQLPWRMKDLERFWPVSGITPTDGLTKDCKTEPKRFVNLLFAVN